MAGFFVKYRTADNEQPLGHEPQTNRHLTSVHKWDPIRTDDRSGMKGKESVGKNFDKIEKNAYFRAFSAFFMQFNLSNKCIRFNLLFSKCCQKCCQNCWGNCSRTMCFYASTMQTVFDEQAEKQRG